MKFYTDNTKIKSGIIKISGIGIIAAIVGVIMMFYDPSDITISVILFAAAAFCAVMAVWISTMMRKGAALEVTDHSIIIGDIEIQAKDIHDVKVYAVLGTMKPIKPQYAAIDLMITMPPEPGLIGFKKILRPIKNIRLPALKTLWLHIRKSTN